MATDAQVADRFRAGNAYTLTQAARLAGTSASTIRNWLVGVDDARSRRFMAPVFGEREETDGEPPTVSFLDLSEIVVVVRWRRLRVKLDRIRAAHKFAREEWGVPYPFATLNLLTLGGHVLGKFQELVPGQKLVVMSSPGQYVLPGIVSEELQQFDYNETDKLADRWYPYGRDVPVVVDPHYAGGRPTVLGRGVTVDILRRRWNVAHESYQDIAKDFGLKAPMVEAILQRVTAT